jgi:predicted GNAT family acetyltransferase
LCYAGANLVPIGADEAALAAFADRAFRQGRRCSSIVGEADQAMALWDRLQRHWGPARDVRACQPLLALDAASAIAPDPLVRRVRPEELEVVLPACVAMFTEEVGISPVADGGTVYRKRVQELLAAGRSFARIENGHVVFKAEVGAVTKRACQVQGVWVDPQSRGRGLSEGGMAAVVEICLREIAPIVSLYVNDFNEAALRAYERVGFRRVGTLASILF